MKQKRPGAFYERAPNTLIEKIAELKNVKFMFFVYL